MFILKTLFNKGEYNIKSKNFNPIKFFTILLLVMNVPFSVYLIIKINKIYLLINSECPTLIENKILEHKLVTEAQAIEKSEKVIKNEEDKIKENTDNIEKIKNKSNSKK